MTKSIAAWSRWVLSKVWSFWWFWRWWWWWWWWVCEDFQKEDLRYGSWSPSTIEIMQTTSPKQECCGKLCYIWAFDFSLRIAPPKVCWLKFQKARTSRLDWWFWKWNELFSRVFAKNPSLLCTQFKNRLTWLEFSDWHWNSLNNWTGLAD